MFCIKCGTQLPEGEVVCSSCGTDLDVELNGLKNTENEKTEVVNENTTEITEESEKVAEVEVIPEPSNEYNCLHSFNGMDYETDKLAQKQLKKARRLADASLGTGIAAVVFLIMGVVLTPLFWFLWFVAFLLGIASFVLSFLSKRAMYELMFNDLYDLQVKKVKLTYRKGKVAAAIAMISTVVGALAIVLTIYYFVTIFLQSDFTEAVKLLWDFIVNAIAN